jgi:hypothetical protein
VYNYVGTGVQIQSERVYNNRRNMHLPAIRRRFENDESRGRSGTVILLPKPTLGSDNVLDAKDIFGELANDQGISNREARDLAKSELEDVINASKGKKGDFGGLF